jgi:hypothetical protein
MRKDKQDLKRKNTFLYLLQIEYANYNIQNTQTINTCYTSKKIML